MFEDDGIDALKFDPETLVRLHAVLNAHPDFAQLVGELHTFPLVIDANKVFRDLLARYRSWGEPTLTECLVRAGVIRVHFPAFGVDEVKSDALDRFAKKQAPAKALREQWEAYQSCLTIDARFSESVPNHPVIRDPKDVPYYELMEAVGAIGVLTEDKDFNIIGLRKMSGDALSPAKDYARAMESLLGIRIGAAGIGMVSVAGLGEGAKLLARGWAAAPDTIKLVMLGAVAFATLHSPTRQRITFETRKLIEKLAPLAAVAGDHLLKDQELKSQADNARLSLEMRRAGAQPVTSRSLPTSRGGRPVKNRKRRSRRSSAPAI